MKVVVQRVSEASCTIENEIYSSIENGMVLLVGFSINDDIEILKKMALKISKLRIFNDELGKMNKNLDYENGSILCISQFTLYGDLSGGNRPSFTKSLPAEEAKNFYLEFVNELKKYYCEERVKCGVFQSEMQIKLNNIGPVTIILDSDELFRKN